MPKFLLYISKYQHYCNEYNFFEHGEKMTHAYTAVMNGRDISHFLNIPKELVDSKILITVDPIEVPLSQTINNLQKLFANAHNIKIANEIQIDAQMEEINDALS